MVFAVLIPAAKGSSRNHKGVVACGNFHVIPHCHRSFLRDAVQRNNYALAGVIHSFLRPFPLDMAAFGLKEH
jgi:hypothetical protein